MSDYQSPSSGSRPDWVNKLLAGDLSPAEFNDLNNRLPTSCIVDSLNHAEILEFIFRYLVLTHESYESTEEVWHRFNTDVIPSF